MPVLRGTIGEYRDTPGHRGALIRTSKVRAKTINCNYVAGQIGTLNSTDVCADAHICIGALVKSLSISLISRLDRGIRPLVFPETLNMMVDGRDVFSRT